MVVQSDDVPATCETTGCHRDTAIVIRHFDSQEKDNVRRASCLPCKRVFDVGIRSISAVNEVQYEPLV